ncbi:MAG: ribulose-phosphate 3-epimerase [FCB group bacterium]|jgi:ribulose-phosphate 3-epimerase|nr:ribulose-phosphate 3-epimerase [FCB group bacterium]
MEQTNGTTYLNEKLTYSASVMCADLGRLEAELKALETSGCDELHFDIMDGQFVPNYTLGFDFIKMARRVCGLPCAAHLMIAQPERYLERFVHAGCSTLTVHVEAGGLIQRTLTQIRTLGASPGIAINPATPLTKLDYLLDYVDRVLVMTVDPGYSGQPIIPSAFERVRILSENIRDRKLPVRIEVDGNINLQNAALLANMGAEILDLGTSSIFVGGDPGEAFKLFKAAVPVQRHLV